MCQNRKPTRLSTTGRVLIPKEVRTTLQWEPGLELLIVETGSGLLLRPKSPFPESTLDEVAGCLKNQGKSKTMEDIENEVTQSALEFYRTHN